MAEKKTFGFRFRLPWLPQSMLPRARELPTQPQRTATQTSVASTPAQRPPFRPPGKSPAPPPPAAPAAAPLPAAPAPATVATPAPYLPRRSPPQPAASPPPPPPPSISPKSSVPESPTAKTTESVAAQPAPTETTQTIVTADPGTPSPSPPLNPFTQAQPQPSPPQTPPSVSPKSSVPESPIAKTTEPVAAPPAKETQTTTEIVPTIENAGPATPPMQTQSPPSPPQTPLPPSVSPKSPLPESPIARSTEPVAAQPANETQATTEIVPTIENADLATPPTQAQSPPSPPQTTPPPSVSPKSSLPESPIAKTTEPVAAQPAKETRTTETIPTIVTAGPATPPSPPQTSPPAKQSPTRTPPRSPSRSASEPTSSPPSPTAKTTSEVSEIKTSTEITGEKNHVDTNNLSLDEKPRETTQTTSINSHSIDFKSRKPELTAIKDDISKYIHKIAAKESTDENPANVITIAGDNTGALMNLSLDEIKGGHKLTTDQDTTINEDESSQKDSENEEPDAIVNSNTQGINNSMMFESFVTERNPGVHLGFYSNLANVDDLVVKNTESIEMQRAEANITPPRQLVYDPTVGRSSEENDPQTSGISYEIEVL
ncbi:hypothetical protein HanIR_Chr09g0438401 [Helianthus annuus]|nr:hypothetical protein HanIR_Chr09g0438401 [Helianthus annuus]